jgi:hypothetical protein
MTAIYLVEQGRSKGTNHREQKHSRRDSRGSDIEALCLPLDSSEAHAEAWEKQDAGEYGANDCTFDERRLSFFERYAVQEDFDDGTEECVDCCSHAHAGLGGNGCHGLPDKVCQRNDGGQSQHEHEAEGSQEYTYSKSLVKDEKIENDEDDQAEQIDEEDVCAVDGVLPVLRTNRAVRTQ